MNREELILAVKNVINLLGDDPARLDNLKRIAAQDVLRNVIKELEKNESKNH